MTTTPKEKENPWVLRIASVVMTIALAVSSYFLNETMGKIKTIDVRVNKIELEQASANGNRFTSNDWMLQKSLLDADKLQTEKRLSTLETTIPQIKDSLIRIEQAVERQNDRLNKASVSR